ncbi:hypothetical protein [Planococcus lenghuensis]|uniref:Uncharacterized protein n=1 Tax=Planococcus lenghuensis TaxID=2213202 RepID=A0A1Q2KVD9_9BACL|nr:hypothetical protein [Planococcus lenghuensis]AQQ52185.1 hypothetical protein B0X71_03030 [Planococcus lenghuensis]
MHLHMMEQPKIAGLDELQLIVNELKAARWVYGPDKEDMEEDDEAWLLLTVIDSHQPEAAEQPVDTIRLLVHFLSEYGWHDDEEMQLHLEQLLSRASAFLPKHKRYRRTFRNWLRTAAGYSHNRNLAI